MRNMKFIILLIFIFINNTYVFADDIKVAYANISKSLDPYEQLTHETLRTTTMVFDPLIRVSIADEYEPHLAHKWKVIDENTTRFYLRDNIYFHSGKRLNVDDVIFTFRRVKTSSEFESMFSPIKDIKAIDDFTFDIISKRSFPLVLNLAALFFPMDSEFYSGDAPNGTKKSQIILGAKSYAAHNASGTGAFTVEEFSSNRIVFSKNKKYWKKTGNNIDSITIEKNDDEDDRVNGVLSGKLDIINPIGINGIEKIRSSNKFKIVNLPGESLLTFLINFERSEGLKNKKIRQAINHAVDRELIINETMKDLATPAEQFSPPMYAGHNNLLKSRYDPKKSLELIKESNFKGPLIFDMIAPKYRDEKISQMIVSMLKEVGIQINLKILPEDDYWDVVDNSGADIMMVGWFSDTKDSNNFFEFLAACPVNGTDLGKFNSGRYCNPEVDQLIQEANVIMKPLKRAEVLQHIEQKLYSDAMHLPLFWENVVWVTKPNIPLESILNGLDVPYFEKLIIN